MSDAVDHLRCTSPRRQDQDRLNLAVSTEVHHRRRLPRSETDRCCDGVLMDREINRGSDQRNLQLRGKEGQRDQMCRNTKSEFNDATVAHGCLLPSQIDFDVVVTK